MQQQKRVLKAISYHALVPQWKDLLVQGMEDDHWQWDWTALGTLAAAGGRKVRARIVAKEDGVWAAEGGVAALGALESLLGIKARSKLSDGGRFRKGQVVCEWAGPARMVLAAERPFLNLASYVSGIATRTARLVEIVEKACPKETPRVTSTRKILPGYRDLALYGVQAGGGYSHRVSLSGGVLIKENHIAAAGGIAPAVEGARAVAPHGLRVEIEVRNERELKQALAAEAEVIMLDNFSPEQVRSALKILEKSAKRPLLEISGGLNEASIADYSIPGVDILSVGSLTHSVRAVDLSLLVND